jgi:hypothetical protein
MIFEIISSKIRNKKKCLFLLKSQPFLQEKYHKMGFLENRIFFPKIFIFAQNRSKSQIFAENWSKSPKNCDHNIESVWVSITLGTNPTT